MMNEPIRAVATVIETPHEGEDVLAVLVLSDGTVLSSGMVRTEGETRGMPTITDLKYTAMFDRMGLQNRDVTAGCIKRWTTEGQLLQSVMTRKPVFSLMEVSSKTDTTVAKHFISCSHGCVDVWILDDNDNDNNKTMISQGNIRHVETLSHKYRFHPPIFRIYQNPSPSSSDDDNEDEWYFGTLAVEGSLLWKASWTTSKLKVSVVKEQPHREIEYDIRQLRDGRFCALRKSSQLINFDLQRPQQFESVTLMGKCRGLEEVEPSGIVVTGCLFNEDLYSIDFYQLDSGLLIRRFPIPTICVESREWFVISSDRSLICMTSESDSGLYVRVWDIQTGACMSEVKCTDSKSEGNGETRTGFYTGSVSSGIISSSDSRLESREHVFAFGEGVRVNNSITFGWRLNEKSRLVIARVTVPQISNDNFNNVTSQNKMFNNGTAHNDAVLSLVARPDGTILSSSKDLTVKVWSADGCFLKRIPINNTCVKSIVPLNDEQSIYVLVTRSLWHTDLNIWHFNSDKNDFQRRGFSLDNSKYWLSSRHLMIEDHFSMDVLTIDESQIGPTRNVKLPDVFDVSYATFLESRNMLLVGSVTGMIKAWDLTTSSTLLFDLTVPAPESPVVVIIQVGDDTVSSYQMNGCISVFDLTHDKSHITNERRLLRSWMHDNLHQNFIFSLSRCMVLLNGGQLCTSRSNNIRIWDVTQGLCLFSVSFPGLEYISCMVERPDRSIVVGFNNGAIGVYRRPVRCVC